MTRSFTRSVAVLAAAAALLVPAQAAQAAPKPVKLVVEDVVLSDHESVIATYSYQCEAGKYVHEGWFSVQQSESALFSWRSPLENGGIVPCPEHIVWDFSSSGPEKFRKGPATMTVEVQLCDAQDPAIATCGPTITLQRQVRINK